MRTPEQVRWDFVHGWLRKAEQDLDACQVLLKEEFPEYSVAAFHAQQAAEKFVKALLVRHQIEFPKTHDLNLLRKLVAKKGRGLAEALTIADNLTPYAVEFRYPSGEIVIPKEEADRAKEIAVEVKTLILQAMHDYLNKGRPG